MDYFSKRIEAEPYEAIKNMDLVQFVWKFIVFHFNLSKVIISDNGSHFISSKFINICKKWKISLKFATPRHPQGNGQAEAYIKMILSTLKKRLEKAKRKWVEELPGVLWAYKTTIQASIGSTPFSLVYGSKAVLPA